MTASDSPPSPATGRGSDEPASPRSAAAAGRGAAGPALPDLDAAVLRVRIARPTERLDALAAHYRDRVGLRLVARFDDHDGFDGAIFETCDGGPQWELTQGPPHAPGGEAGSGWSLGWSSGWSSRWSSGWSSGGTSGVSPAGSPAESPGPSRADPPRDPDGHPAPPRPAGATCGDVCFTRRSAAPRDSLAFYRDRLGLRDEPGGTEATGASGAPEATEAPEATGATGATGATEVSGASGATGATLRLPGGCGRLSIEAAAGPAPAPSVEDLLVLYFADRAARDAWAAQLAACGAPRLRPHNPWWHTRAICFADPDGYGIALAIDD